MQMKNKIFFAFAALSLLCGCKPELVILHVNDTHSHYEPVNYGSRKGQAGIIQRAALVDSVRAVHGDENVLLLHAGDFSQGSTYYSELKGQFEPRIINALRYDCITLGNHEFDDDIESLTERLSQLTDTKVVCANVDFSQFELAKYVSPYAILNKAGRKIGIIGLETNLSRVVSRVVSSRLPQLDNVKETNRWADFLKNEQKCDIVILLSHQGYEGDMWLVPQIRNVDLVIGGHSHTFLEDFTYVKDIDGKKVPIIQAGEWGYRIGEIKVR